MTIFHAILLGIVEGITEFLPISSTGHLVLVSHLLSLPQTEFLKSFEIIIQLGAVFAIGTLYFRTILSKPQLLVPLLLSFVPSAVVGFLLYSFIKGTLFDSPFIIVLMLFLGGLFLLFFERFLSTPSITFKTLTWKQTLIIGLAQSLSVVPGVSRAASTIVGGMFAGLSRSDATEFSFLLAVPTIMAASVLDVIKTPFVFTSESLVLLLVGFIVSFLCALITVRLFLSFIQKRDFKFFGVYRVGVALAFFFLIVIRI
jgi:undecaprenyl-diphosphatase